MRHERGVGHQLGPGDHVGRGLLTRTGHPCSRSRTVYDAAPAGGNLSSVLFGVALLASGLSSSAVGTLAGQVILEVPERPMSIFLRRLLTIIPALS